ncbi:Flp pilus assembly protein CpaB, partial [bacterium]|nr:Flp pilus assembly protein CpaB [bacterium]
MKNKKLLIIALSIAFVTVFLVGGYLNNLEKAYLFQGKKVEVLVARDYIPSAAFLKKEMVKSVKVPLAFRQPGALVSLEELTGKKGRNIYSTIVPIMIGEQIVATKLNSLEKGTRLSFVIPQEKGAISLGVDRVSGVSGLIRAGDRVNLICTFEYEKRNKLQVKTITLLQNLLVLAVNKRLIGTIIPKTKKGKYQNSITEEELRTVTLSVTPEEAEKIIFAAHQGEMIL